MRRVQRSVAVAVIMAAFAIPTGTASAAMKPCIAQLATQRGGGMSEVVDFWQDDFLGVGMRPGHYAAHIAQMRSDCPE